MCGSVLIVPDLLLFFMFSLSSNRNYVVAVSVRGQLLSSSVHFAQLQCWVGSLRSASPVEPEVEANSNHILGFSFGNNSRSLKMDDVYDMRSWHTQWPADGGKLAPIFSKKQFLSDIRESSRNVILAQFVYKTHTSSFCEFSWTDIIRDLEQFPLLHVSRKVCIHVGNPMQHDVFLKLILGDVVFENVVIVINDWTGLGEERVNLLQPECTKLASYGRLHPSRQVLWDAEVYATRHLGGLGQYLSVSARFEKIFVTYDHLSLKQKRIKLKEAIHETMTVIRRFKNEENFDNVFVTSDFGKDGSHTFQMNNYYNCGDVMSDFVQNLTNISSALHEQSFKDIKHQHPVYTVGLNKLFFFSSLLFYSFMLVLSTYYSFDYTYYSSIILIKKMFKNVVHI